MDWRIADTYSRLQTDHMSAFERHVCGPMKSSSASGTDHLPRCLIIRRPQVILNAPKPGEMGLGICMGSSHPSSYNSRSYTSPVKAPTGSILGSGGHVVSIAAASLPAVSP